ncbi:MAG: glycogen debranching protein [Synechococcaceae cyanobacterium RL_1_2]|nr:glycogen debranching protein [Synechococcaceae cyanobacterium RL_1_2]
MTIWVNEQIDACGIVQACIATTNQGAAEDCHREWQNKLSQEQQQQGWQVSLRTVESWDEVPVNSLKLSI